jgi:hypothetical protein
MCDVKVLHQRHWSHRIREVANQLDVPTILTRTSSLATCCVFTLCVVRKRSASWSTTQSWDFSAPEWAVQVQRWSPWVSSWNFLQPQVERGFSTITGIWEPMDVAKNVYQRLADQTSSRRWGLICPSQLSHRLEKNTIIRLETSSSWDSRSVISVRRTESSAVVTIRWWERRPGCSAWRDPAKTSISVRRSDTVLSGNHCALLRAQTYLFNATRDRKK